MQPRATPTAAAAAERRKLNNLSFINEGEVKEPTHYAARRTPRRNNDDAIIEVTEFNESVTPQTPRLLLPMRPSTNPSGVRISSLVKSQRASRVSMVLQSTAVYQRMSMAPGVQPSFDGILSESARTPVLGDEKPSSMYSFDSSTSAMDTRRNGGGAPSNILGSMRDFDTVRGMKPSMAKLHALRDLLGGMTDVNGHIDRATFSHTFDIADTSAYVTNVNANQINAKALLVDTCVELDIDDEEKLAFIFDTIDQDNRMYVTSAQVADLLAANFASFKLEAVGTSFKDMADALFAKMHVSDDRMTYQIFREVFGPFLAAAYDDDDANDIALMEQHLPGQEPETKSKLSVFYERHHLRILWLLLYFLANAIVFLFKWQQYPVDPALGYGLKIARACAQVCMLNFGIVLLPMCRSIVQVMKRSVLLWHMVPFDDHIEFHKIVGTTLLTAGLVHTGAHVSNEIHLYCLATPAQIRASIFVTRNVSMFASGAAPPFTDMLLSLPVWTGVILLVITCIAFPLAAIPKFRQGNFNLFWYSHMLFFPFLLVGCLHGLAGWLATPSSFFWIAPPLAIYLLERRLRYAKIFTTPLRIIRARMLDGVVALYIEKPKRFHYRPGMYLYLNVPKLSSHEWHPFTISSAPGDQYLSVHVRNAGDWTKALHDLINQVHKGECAYPQVYIDGPVGAPTQDYHRFKTIVMIGGGIGVTPFASILKDVVHLWGEYRCLNCQHVRHPRSFRIQKMYFHWVTRGQESLGWFQDTMNQIADMDKDNVIEVHQYLSTVKTTDKTLPQLKMIQAVVHDATGRDVVSGLINSKQMTHFGRPNWDAVFHNLTRKHRGEEVGVFFCGPHALDKILQEMCHKYSSDPETGGVYFDYHSEKFA